MEYRKTYNLWKRTGYNLTSEKRQTIIHNQENLPLLVGEYSDKNYAKVCLWDVEEKIDGTNIMISLRETGNHYRITIEGRTKNSEVPQILLDYLKKEFTSEKLLKGIENTSIKVGGHGFNRLIVFFGEGIGTGIQGDYYNLKKPEFILFDIYENGKYASRKTVRQVAEQMGIKSAPHLGKMTEDQIIDFVKLKPISQINKDVQSEGVVCRGEAYEYQENGPEEYLGPQKFKLKCIDL